MFRFDERTQEAAVYAMERTRCRFIDDDIDDTEHVIFFSVSALLEVSGSSHIHSLYLIKDSKQYKENRFLISQANQTIL